MNRELKFRGKRIDKNEWVYGGLSYTQNKDKYFINTFDSSGFMIMLEVNPNSVGQLTGLLDSEGKEVWEGDFVKFKYKHYHEFTPPLVVFFSNLKYGGWSIQLCEDKKSPFSIGNESECIKVVGNIIDNPELLECVY
jgi:uncharacterized phage protein (TIGR01671 family)